MGTSVSMARLPAVALCQLFAAVLARLPRHHVLRTWAGIVEYSIDDLELLSALPANVRVRDWLLQKDILGHKQILKLIIIHGGLLSQHDVVRQLELAHLDEEAPYRTIYVILHNDCYLHAVGYANHSTLPLVTQPTNCFPFHSFSRCLRLGFLVDQLVSDISLVVYWNKNVIKHFGALASSWQTYEFGLICYNYHYAVKSFSL